MKKIAAVIAVLQNLQDLYGDIPVMLNIGTEPISIKNIKIITNGTESIAVLNPE